jgi:hypothetical protein
VSAAISVVFHEGIVGSLEGSAVQLVIYSVIHNLADATLAPLNIFYICINPRLRMFDVDHVQTDHHWNPILRIETHLRT